MNDMMKMLQGAEPREILQAAIEKNVNAIISYLTKGKWHVAKVLLKGLGANRLSCQISPRKKPHPMNIQVNQPVGVSIKHGYGKFVFETVVVDLEPSKDAENGGTIILSIPDRVEIVQRRSYFRVDVPKSLKVNVLLWHRRQRQRRMHDASSGNNGNGRKPAAASKKKQDLAQVQENIEKEPALNSAESSDSVLQNGKVPFHNYWQGQLVDISAGGAQVVINTEMPLCPGKPGTADETSAQKPEFKEGQFIGLRFTPMPYETPLMLDAQIRSVLPTVDENSICLGLQIVGLEASHKGREVLQRLCNVVERYYQINQSSAKQQDMQSSSHLAISRRTPD